MTSRVLRFSVATEAATGLAALVVPSFLGQVLLGVEVAEVASTVVRCFGIALIALSIAAWPGAPPAEAPTRALRGMAVYNALIALFLGYVGAVEPRHGPLLWPAVALHAMVAVLLTRPQRA